MSFQSISKLYLERSHQRPKTDVNNWNSIKVPTELKPITNDVQNMCSHTNLCRLIRPHHLHGSLSPPIAQLLPQSKCPTQAQCLDWTNSTSQHTLLYSALLTACNLVCSIFSIWCAWSALNVAPPHTTGCVNNQQCSRDCLSKIAVEVLTWLRPFTRILPGNDQNKRRWREHLGLI